MVPGAVFVKTPAEAERPHPIISIFLKQLLFTIAKSFLKLSLRESFVNDATVTFLAMLSDPSDCSSEISVILKSYPENFMLAPGTETFSSSFFSNSLQKTGTKYSFEFIVKG